MELKDLKRPKETYRHTETCSNCGITNSIDIPKGIRIEEHLKTVYCITCGCRLRKGNYFTPFWGTTA